MKVFDVLKTPIVKDKIMIEASAGTGKTYSIGLLTLRLIIEQGYKIDEIVLVTFTNAAAFELKSRTLDVIRDARDYYLNNSIKVDKNIKTIVDNNRDNINDKLEDSINNINKALIFTIHGFCSYLLKKHPFTFNVNLESRFVNDDSEIIKKLINSFYEEKVNELPLDVINKLSNTNGFSDKESLIKQIRELYTKPYSKYVGYEPNLAFVDEFKKRSLELALSFKGRENELSVDSYKFLPKSKINFEVERLKEFINDPLESLFPYENLTKQKVLDSILIKEDYTLYDDLLKDGVSSIYLDLKYNKDGKTISKRNSKITNDINQLESFVANYKDILEAAQNYFNFIYNAPFYLYDDVIKKLKMEKIKLEVKTNDDLIMDVYNHLKDVENEEFSYLKVLMVDEFQDTDQIQFQIFNTLFKDKTFLMIGDPKQSMYRFRGGDINAYNSVKRETSIIYSMDTNYRSQDKAILKVNEYYEKTNGLTKSEILYHPIKTGRTDLTEPSDNKGPLFYWEYSGDENINLFKYLGKKDIIKEIYRLKETVMIDGKKVKNSDIAILTHNHQDAKGLYKTLFLHGLPSVLLKTQNIFLSKEFKFFKILITAVLNFNSERAINTLLTNDFMDSKFTFESIRDELEIESKSDVVKSLFKCYEESKEIGILKALNNFIDKYNIIGSLSIDKEEGRRSVSNFKLILNIIGDYEIINNSLEGLLLHFSYSKDNEGEEFEERLESDDDAINILTYHASKGLEWPFVFIFNINASSSSVSSPIKFHRDGNLYYSFEKEDSEYELEELLAEKEKIFYVAITRAKYRTYILYSTKTAKNYFNEAVDLSVLESISNTNKPHYNYEIEAEVDNRKILIKNFTKDDKLKETLSFSSYSALSNKIDVPLVIEKEYLEDMMPSSAHIGTIIHEILEDVDFNNPNVLNINSYFNNISNVTNKHIKWLESRIEILFNKEIIQNKHTLKDIKKGNYINELEFLLSSKNLNINSLSKFLLDYGINHNIIDKGSVKGYLKGFIDVVFYLDNKYYIIDWKSNYIGPTEDSYNLGNISKEMEKNLYYLQYLIYTVALLRYLKTINKNFNYDKDFGGVYYIFIRGINKDNDNGIYFNKPNYELIKDLDKIIGGGRDE